MKPATGIPAGAVRLEAYAHRGQVVILGTPPHSEDEEAGHNCDAMGCGQDHVLARLPVDPETWAQLTAGHGGDDEA